MQVSAQVSAAVSLALDDLLPRGVKSPRNATPDERCLYRRDSYDVEAAPPNDDVLLVRFRVRKVPVARREDGDRGRYLRD